MGVAVCSLQQEHKLLAKLTRCRAVTDVLCLSVAWAKVTFPLRSARASRRVYWVWISHWDCLLFKAVCRAKSICQYFKQYIRSVELGPLERAGSFRGGVRAPSRILLHTQLPPSHDLQSRLHVLTSGAMIYLPAGIYELPEIAWLFPVRIVPIYIPRQRFKHWDLASTAHFFWMEAWEAKVFFWKLTGVSELSFTLITDTWVLTDG